MGISTNGQEVSFGVYYEIAHLPLHNILQKIAFKIDVYEVNLFSDGLCVNSNITFLYQ